MIALKSFAGEYPRQKPTLLPEIAAQSAVDCDFGQTVLTGIRARSLTGVHQLPVNIRSVYAQEGTVNGVFSWPYEVDVVRGPVVNDRFHRFYWADGEHYYVSNGSVGGFGLEPSPTNRFKVGVPCPAAPLVINSVAMNLTLPGTTGYDFKAIYEQADGTVILEHVLGSASALEHSPTSIVGTWATSLSGTIGEAEGGAGVTGLIYDSAQSGFHVYKTENFVIGTLNLASSAVTVTLFFHHDDYLNSPLPLSSGKYELAYIYGSTSAVTGHTSANYKTLTIPFYPLGYGWYASRSGAQIPAGASGVAQAAAGTLAMLMTTTLEDGSVRKTIIRLNGNHTIPAEYADFNFTFAATNGNLTLSISANETFKEFRAYTYTYVNQFGEESGYALPATADVLEGQKVHLTYATLPDDSGYCPITLIRVYRTASGSAGTNYGFVAEFTPNANNPVFVDEVDGDALGPGSGTSYFEPPPQNLQGVCLMSNGIVAGFVGNELYFMEPYLPYAHNPSYTKPLGSHIVGICPTDDGLYVTTTTYPYLITGVSPDSMVDRRIPSIAAGVSKKSICSIGSSVVYASHDGLVMLRGIDASLDLSFSFFTREVWRDRYADKLEHMRLDAHDGNLLAWFDDGTPGFLIRTEGAATLTRLTDPIYASFTFALKDGLYVAAGSALYNFKGDANTKAFIWHSKDFILPKPVNFGCVQLIGAGAVTFSVYADGALIHTHAVTLEDVGHTVFRLPAGFLARRWSIKLAGSANTTISECSLAYSPSELQIG